MRRDEIKSLVREHKGPGFAQIFKSLVEGRTPEGRECSKLRERDWPSFRDLWEALHGPAEETLPTRGESGRLLQEAVDSSAFPSAVGVLINAKVIEGYEAAATVGDQLVTTMPSKLRTERIVGFTSLEAPREIPEGMAYEASSFQEKYVTSEAIKRGRIIEVTEETILFDQTGQILMRASRIGEMAAQEREEAILAGVVDVGSGAAGYKDVYRPSGTAEALYSAGNNNLLATATPLVDWTDLDEALQYHADTVRDDRAISGERRPILWRPTVLLTAQKKAATGARILAATEVRSQPGAADATNVLITGNPSRSLVPGLTHVFSPLLDFLAGVTGSNYNDADDWFLGDPKKQFVWQEVWPLQVFRSRQDDEAAFRQDIVARFKVRYFGAVAAIDERYFIKINAV